MNRREADVLALLGLARRAGRAIVGSRAVEEAVRAGGVKVAVLAGDVSANTRQRVRGLLARSSVPVLELGDRNGLGGAVGKGPVAVVGVTDSGLASRLLNGVADTLTGKASGSGRSRNSSPRRGTVVH